MREFAVGDDSGAKAHGVSQFTPLAVLVCELGLPAVLIGFCFAKPGWRATTMQVGSVGRPSSGKAARVGFIHAPLAAAVHAWQAV